MSQTAGSRENTSPGEREKPDGIIPRTARTPGTIARNAHLLWSVKRDW
jgi:hypothetical protein